MACARWTTTGIDGDWAGLDWSGTVPVDQQLRMERTERNGRHTSTTTTWRPTRPIGGRRRRVRVREDVDPSPGYVRYEEDRRPGASVGGAQARSSASPCPAAGIHRRASVMEMDRAGKSNLAEGHFIPFYMCV
jgi:hypothetical protein